MGKSGREKQQHRDVCNVLCSNDTTLTVDVRLDMTAGRPK